MIQTESGRTQYTSYAIPMEGGVQRVPMVRTRFYTPVTSPATGVWYKVIARHSGKSMDVQNGSTADGANVWQWSTTGNYAQIWMLEDAGGGYVKIKNRNSGKYLDADLNGGGGNGTNVQQWTGNGATQQQWQLISKGGGYFAIKSRWCGRLVDVSGPSEAQQANIHLWDDLNATNQQWAFATP
jgi:hypothetical protein